MIIFGRRVQKNVYAKATGQPGAAGWALDNMRGQWRVTQAVAGTTQLDAVHRVIGRPGVILVAEGAPHRTKGLVAQEKKRIARIVGQVPIYEVLVGDEEGQVPLSKLQRHVTKLPRNIDKSQMETVEKRLAALANRGGPAMPKGPMPQRRPADEGHAAHRPPAVAHVSASVTTTVRLARSWMPRESRSRISAGTMKNTDAVRTRVQSRPTPAEPGRSRRTTRSPSSAIAGVAPMTATGTTMRIAQVSRLQFWGGAG